MTSSVYPSSRTMPETAAGRDIPARTVPEYITEDIRRAASEQTHTTVTVSVRLPTLMRADSIREVPTARKDKHQDPDSSLPPTAAERRYSARHDITTARAARTMK